MAKEYDISQTLLYKTTAEWTNEGRWPFYTVHPNEFLDASRDLIQMSECARNKTVNGQKLPVEAIADKIDDATVKMLACLRKMEMEASSRELEARRKFAEIGERDLGYLPAEEFVKLAKVWMYTYNNKACDYISNELDEKGIRPNYIDIKNEQSFDVDKQKEFTKRATTAHEDAMSNVYAEIENIIKYGLPSTHPLAKVKDAFMLSDTIKANNQKLIDKLLSSEIDIETIKLYIIPGLKMKMDEYYTYSLLEKHQETNVNLGPKYRQNANPDYFRRNYQMYVSALKEISDAVKAMEEREKDMAGEYKLKINKPGKGQVELIAERNNPGKQVVQDTTKKTWFGLNKSVKRTKEKFSHEESIIIKVGKTSKKFYEEIRKKAKKLLGYDSRRSLTTDKKRGFANVFSVEFWRRSIEKRRTSKMTGKETSSIKAEVKVFGVDEKVVYTNGEKDTAIVDMSVDVGAAEIHAQNDAHLVSIGASATAAQAKVEAANGFVKASATAGSIGMDTKPDLKKYVKNQIFEHAVGNGQSIDDAAKGFIDESKKKLTDISTTNLEGKVTVAGIKILSHERDNGEFKETNRIPEIKNAAKNTVEHVKELGYDIHDGLESFGQKVGTTIDRVEEIAQQVGDVVQNTAQQINNGTPSCINQIEQAYNDMQLGIADEITESGTETHNFNDNQPIIEHAEPVIETQNNPINEIVEPELDETIDISGR